VSKDFDTFLLDGVFQRVSDRLTSWSSCFGLARLSLTSLIILQTAVLAWDLRVLTKPSLIVLAITATLLEYGVALFVQRHIDLAESQTQARTVNLHRIILRPFRMVLLALTSAAFIAWIASGLAVADTCSLAVISLWFITVYFMSCTSNEPPQPALERSLVTMTASAAH
jgi:lipopolysaccharide export LptBFGC system permease protein LptF